MAPPNRLRSSNRLRIIGGAWRGRKLSFPDSLGLRPTPDRVRETLFNWLQPVIRGARCLDLFAGSGALGFEAISRGAAQVMMVEQDAQVIASLRGTVDMLGTTAVELVHAEALAFIRQARMLEAFDVVFLDPPFGHHLIEACVEPLTNNGWLANHALIYLETESTHDLPDLSAYWQVTHAKRAGQVAYYLARNDQQHTEVCSTITNQ